MTLDGTNTWLLIEPGSARAVCVDPGPDHPGHRAALIDAADQAGARIELILLTHGHLDHSEGARALHEQTGASVLAADPAHRLGGEGLQGGQVIREGGLELVVVATPGHTSDSLSFLLTGDPALPTRVPTLLTGDTVLGRGSTMVAYPDGDLSQYLESLGKLGELVGAVVHMVLPGHGPVLPDAAAAVEKYTAHRRARLAAVAQALAAGHTSVADVVAVVYADVPQALRPAAELSVRAQLAYLGRLHD